jgi:hypothetical protein
LSDEQARTSEIEDAVGNDTEPEPGPVPRYLEEKEQRDREKTEQQGPQAAPLADDDEPEGVGEDELKAEGEEDE